MVCVLATEMVTTFYLLLAHPSVGVQSVQELVALARNNGSSDDATVLLVQRACFGDPHAGWVKGLVGSLRPRGPKQ